MAVQKILVVDDEARMRKLVSDFLVREGYEVLEAANGEEAMDLFYADKEIVLIILDVMMPKMDGWQALREIRESSQVPVIMLTARTDERDELKGFDLGVDEYVTKPFSPRTLVARVNAILRRTASHEENDRIELGGIVLDKSAHQVTIDGEPVELSFKELSFSPTLWRTTRSRSPEKRSSTTCGTMTILATQGPSTPMSKNSEASSVPKAN